MNAIIALAFIALVTPVRQVPSGALQRVVYVIGTSGSAYRRGYFRNLYRNYIRDSLKEVSPGSIVTCIAYDSDAGFYPCDVTYDIASDVLSPIGQELSSTRDYWLAQYKAGHLFEKAHRAGSRLDKALELVMEERQNWPAECHVKLVFMTEGGVDWVGATNRQIDQAGKAIQRDFDSLAQDGRVSQIVVAGVIDQPGSRLPNRFFGAHTIEQQWKFFWLKQQPNAAFVRLSG